MLVAISVSFDPERDIAMTEPDKTDFEKAAEDRGSGGGILREFWDFLVHNKKWWLLPILLVLLLFGILMILGSSAAAPFIYTLF
jgi:hypothetical protein